MTPEEMIKKFLCPGCVSGEDCLDIQLIKFNDEQTGFNCLNYCAGTRILGLGKIFLSMPKGFNRVGNNPAVEVRLFLEGNKPIWDNLNVPVWAMVHDGFLFVRTFSPRISYQCIDIIENGSPMLVPNAIDVSKFIEEID